MIRLSRKYRFSASHRLYSPALTEQRNREIYGKCANPYGHGHDYEVEVTVAGAVDSVTGRSVSLAALDDLMHAEIVEAFRYKYLNEEVEAFRFAVPTTENLAAEAARRLIAKWQSKFGTDGPRFENIRIWETERNICEVSGRGLQTNES